MGEDPCKTLFHPFARGLLAVPDATGRWLFAGARAGCAIPDGFDAQLICVQGFRPDHDALAAAGRRVVPTIEQAGEGFDGALVLLGRDRGANERALADCARAVRPAGLVVASGAITDGAASLRKRLAATLPSLQHVSKHHGVAFWCERPEEAALEALSPPVSQPLAEGRFRTAPGMFSHAHVDPGSALLAAHLPRDLAGAVADFGAGWGYLSVQLAERCPAVASIDLYEADFDSLQAARVNLAGARCPVGFHWHDLTTQPALRRYEAIVMNPPFHAVRQADPALGRAFIAAAAAALHRGGRLLMIANRQLPYEAALRDHFARFAEIAGDGRYKVIEAVR